MSPQLNERVPREGPIAWAGPFFDRLKHQIGFPVPLALRKLRFSALVENGSSKWCCRCGARQHEASSMQTHSSFLILGDSIECTVSQPRPGRLVAQLVTEKSLAYGRELLADPKSGWRKSAIAPAVSAPAVAHASEDGLASEGWALFEIGRSGLVEIQRDDEMAIFQTDEDALEHVKRMAAQGSQPHKDALARHMADAPHVVMPA
ncbi:hypothetical protein [Pseudomonas aeruginosa]|uniref:hypothetical protein n=1 Tax=Pseudomonas aeruginosa TaxID=287 RepID=UPI000F547763|nr:hypothetical protein [Pseudomonas aeruginosa]